MQAQLKLVNATVGKRLLAKIIDVLPPLLVFGICWGIAWASLAVSDPTAAQAGAALAGALIWLTVGGLLSLAYGLWIWGWEATTGKTPGNLAVGLRTTNEVGLVPGWGAIFVRNLLVGVAWIVPVIGPLVVTVSALWDSNAQRQGWHDKVARTLMCDVKAGRDPLTTGGLTGPASFAPPADAGLPAVNPVGIPSVTPGRAARLPNPSSSAGSDSRWALPAIEPVETRFAPPAASDPSSSAGSDSRFAPPRPEVSPVQTPAHPDDELDQTRLSAPRSSQTAVLAAFDDGTTAVLNSTALLGRNPSANEGETVEQLIDFADLGRSVSKTHLHLLVEGTGVWVTDRGSTNGSAITSPDGVETKLAAGEPMLASSGSQVSFGDRHFIVSRPV